MTITVINETEEKMEFDIGEIAEAVVLCTLDKEEFLWEGEVNVTLVDEFTIKDLNSRMRKIDSVTDVLSFPMIEYESPGNFSSIEEKGDNFNPDTGEAMLGDIVICVPRMKEQAQEFGHSIKREFAFLIAHSMLHLLGYDHMTQAEENIMFSRQEEILMTLGIGRR